MLETKNLSIGYGKKRIQSGLNLTAAKGKMICLIGKNGTGKSTLLRTLAGLQKPLDGTVTMQGRNIAKLSEAQRATLFSLVLTDNIVVENMTMHDLVAMGRFPYTNWAGRLSDNDEKTVTTALAQVDLTHKAQAFAGEVSDGERQRGIIAKALAQDTPLVLLDEPTAHLDLPNRIEIMLLLRRLSAETNKTFILSTHELDLAMQTADRLWLMRSDGVTTGIPEDMMLRGDIERAFGSDNFHFDTDGHCSVKPPAYNRFVSIDGDTPAAAWLQRALARNGIGTDDNADTEIEINSEGFRLLGRNVRTIEETLDLLTAAQTQKNAR